MKNRQTVVAALAGILAGTVIGAGAYYSAQLVSYRYTDQDNFRQIVEKRDLSVGDGQSTYVNTHTAAPMQNEESDECDDLTGQRRTRCIGAARDGIEYQRGELR
jgi:hypothetical protein